MAHSTGQFPRKDKSDADELKKEKKGKTQLYASSHHGTTEDKGISLHNLAIETEIAAFKPIIESARFNDFSIVN